MRRTRIFGPGFLALTLVFASSAVQAQINASPVAAAIKQANFSLDRIAATPPNKLTYENTIGAMDDVIVRLRLDTEFLQFMAYVSPNAELRDAGNKAEQAVRDWGIEVGQREDLYKVCRAFADSNPKLNASQKRLLAHTLRDFRRAGMALSESERGKLKDLKKQINELSLEFEKNIREDETRVLLNANELAGMSDDYLKQQQQVDGVYFIGLDYPSFLPLMDYCENEATRKKVWIAYKRRGGNRNVKVLEKILKLRAQEASLLGYQHAADYETEIKMAKSAANVQDFYKKLRPLVRKKAELDLEEFTAAKRSHTGDSSAKMYPWDQSFYEKRLLKEKYAVDSEKVREYFPMDKVIAGLFRITQSLYGVTYKDITKSLDPKEFRLWHPDVLAYEVFDRKSGKSIGRFFLDLHPRDNKYGHAAQWGLHPRKRWSDGSLQKPVAALVCNFTKPTKEKPSLLSHDEVETFFHEFGHLLHSILTDVEIGQFSGTSVARDFVEAPSQMFEHWVWDADVLKTFTSHYKTGQPLPTELLDGMIRAKYLASGIKAERQIYYGMVDMAYHTNPTGEVDTTAIALRLADEVEVYDSVSGTYFQSAFGHLTGYQAGYYGYLWSLVYAEDMFQRFQELGLLNPDAGRYYRDKVLSRGGTLDEMDMLKNYLGREPKMDAFLKNLGLESPARSARR